MPEETNITNQRIKTLRERLISERVLLSETKKNLQSLEEQHLSSNDYSEYKKIYEKKLKL